MKSWVVPNLMFEFPPYKIIFVNVDADFLLKNLDFKILPRQEYMELTF